MQQVSRYCKRAKISEAKFRYLLRLFALDLTASDTARLTGLSVRSVNARMSHQHLLLQFFTTLRIHAIRLVQLYWCTGRSILQ